MKQQLGILFVNNSNEDIQKMVRELERGGYQVISQQVDSFSGLKDALATRTWDLLVSDYSSGQIKQDLIAQTLRTSVEDLPYIIYSQVYREKDAIAALNAGARDYFANGSYGRLVPIVERELIEARIRRERKRSEIVQASLLKFSQTVLTVQNLEQLYALIHSIIGELMPADNFYIALYDPLTDFVHYPYYVDQYDQNPLPEKPGKSLTAYVLRTGEMLLASPQVFDQLVDRGEVELFGSPSIDWLGVPLKIGDTTIGVFVVQSYTEGIRFTQEHAYILAFFSTHVAIAIERKRAEEALRAESTFRKAIEASMMAGIFVIDLEQRINYINPAFCRMLGWGEAELLGTKSPYPFWPPEEIETILEAYQVTTGEDALPSDFELKFLRRNGDRFDVLIMVAPLSDQQGKTTGWLSSVYDITQRKKADAALKKSEERYRQAVENSPNPIFSVGRYKTIQMWNLACERVFGYGQGIIGNPYHFLMSDVNEAHLLDEKVDLVFQRQSFNNLVLRLNSQEGRKLFVDARLYPVLDSEGNVQSCVFAGTDLTDRMEAEQALRRRNAILQVVSNSAEQFLKNADWEKNITEFLKQLGTVTESNRVYIYENGKSAEGKLIAHSRFEWIPADKSPNVESKKLPSISYLAPGFTRWESILRRGEVFTATASELPVEEKSVLNLDDIHSIIVVPIFAGPEWWGIIGLDDCICEQQWCLAEIDALRTGANIIGAAIQQIRI